MQTMCLSVVTTTTKTGKTSDSVVADRWLTGQSQGSHCAGCQKALLRNRVEENGTRRLVVENEVSNPWVGISFFPTPNSLSRGTESEELFKLTGQLAQPNQSSTHIPLYLLCAGLRRT